MKIEFLKGRYEFLKKNYFSPKEFVKNKKLQKQWLVVIVIANDALSLHKNNIKFDEMLDLLVGFELNPNIQSFLEHHLALAS